MAGLIRFWKTLFAKTRSKRRHGSGRAQRLGRASDICRLPTSSRRRRRGGAPQGDTRTFL